MTNQQPNIVFFMTDQQRADTLGCYGNQVCRTPNIDRIASDGVLFTNHFVQNPVCTPSRSSVFTGRYPSCHGSRINGIPLRDDEITPTQLLADSGYHTCIAGKAHFRPQLYTFDPSKGAHIEYEGPGPYYGFQEFYLSDDNKVGPYLEWIDREYPQYAEAVQGKNAKMIGRTGDCWTAEYPAEIHQSSWIADRAVDFIRSSKKPFFLFCSFVDPHHPFNPPEPYASMYDNLPLPPLVRKEGELEAMPEPIQQFAKKENRFTEYGNLEWKAIRRRYYGMVSLIDDAVGRVMEALREEGLRESTLVIFTSDHGELLGDHHLLYKGAFPFDSLIKVPMLWHMPGYLARGLKFEGLSQEIDIMPTLLDLVDIDIPVCVQGVSMLEKLKGKVGRGHDSILVECILPGQKADINTLVTEKWKYTCWTDGSRGQLFDRRNDPNELNNLWDNPEYREIRLEMAENLIAKMSQAREPLYRQTAKW